MSQSTDNLVESAENGMDGQLDATELRNRAIDGVGSSLTDTKASEASDPAEAPTLVLNGEIEATTILKTEQTEADMLEEAVAAGNEVASGEVANPAVNSHKSAIGADPEYVNSDVVHNMDSEESVETPVVAKMVVELQSEPGANLPSTESLSEDSYDSALSSESSSRITTPAPCTPAVDAAPEAGPETSVSTHLVASASLELSELTSIEPSSTMHSKEEIPAHTDTTQAPQTSTTSAPVSESTSSSSNVEQSTVSDPSPSQIAPELRIITTSEATSSSPALLETLTVAFSQSDAAKSPETVSPPSSSAPSDPASGSSPTELDSSTPTDHPEINEISTLKTEPENPSRKIPPVASSSAPDLRASVVKPLPASSNDKPASLQTHSGSVGSRMMNLHEENELERLRAERAQRPHGRRGAFYAPPPPAFRPKLGANHADVIPDPPLSNSGIVLPLNSNPTVKPTKDIRVARRLTLGWAETTGKRPTMEDAWTCYSQGKDSASLDVFGVFDGHRGDSAAKFAAEHVANAVTSVMRVSKNPGDWLRLGFIQTNLAMKQAGIATGTTAVVGMYWRNVVYLANAGDSRCVHGRVGNGAVTTTRMTQDHKPERLDETERIVALGGEVHTSVSKEGKVVGRVNGQLGVSRALGDFDLEPFIIPDPEITSIDLLKPGTLAETIQEVDEATATSSSAPVEPSSSQSAAPRASSSNSASPSNHSAINTASTSNQSPSGNVLSNQAISSPSTPANTTSSNLAASPPLSSLTSSAPPASPMMDTAATPANPRGVSNSNGSRSLNSSPMKNKPRPTSTNGKKLKGDIAEATSEGNVQNLTPNFDFLIMACDGLWDVVTDEEAVDIAAHVLQSNQTPEDAAKRLRNVAFGRGSTDNITVLIILLQTPILGLKKSSSCIIL